jgi:hypothetical protein
MDSVSRNYMLATIVGLIVLIAVYLVILDTTESFLILVDIVLYPCAVLGLYLFLEGRGERMINGIDFSSMGPEARKSASSRVGLYMTVSMVILCFAVSIIADHILLGFLLMGVSIVIIVASLIGVEKASSKPFITRSTTVKAVAFVCVTVLCVLPGVLVSASGVSSEAVTVEFLDDGVRIKAPMEDHTFAYDSIDQLTYDPDFEKGSRIWGYGTPNISSGTFKNDAFGRYTLMSYTKVDPCVFFFYEGEYYAFNQSTDGLTESAYEELVKRVV